jgi:sulfate adenylyltransferase
MRKDQLPMLEKGILDQLDTAAETTSTNLITPHGGTLVDRRAIPLEQDELRERAAHLVAIKIDSRVAADIECISTGIYSPLTGFMEERDYISVVEDMRLASGLPWTIPVTLAVSDEDAQRIKLGDEVSLVIGEQAIAILTVADIFRRNKPNEAHKVYRTAEEAHPGVAVVYEGGDTCLGGPITLIRPLPHDDFFEYRLTPEQTRAEFARRGWRTIVAFQTRNPIHRAHEYLQKVALEITDGLFVNPLVGTTKGDDVSADVRMRTYETILSRYYPAQRTLLSVFPASMRYAGPREAIMHAIARKNYGCTHFIVGRDHAGVGNYYGTYDAQRMFDAFTPDELGIVPLKFEHAHYCQTCGQLVTSKTCPHDQTNWIHLSGTKVREMLSNGQMPPPEFTRPEVAKILIDAYSHAQASAMQI